MLNEWERFCRDEREKEIRADERRKVLDEVIKLFNEMRPSLATHISDFGDMLEQMKEQEEGEQCGNE